MSPQSRAVDQGVAGYREPLMLVEPLLFRLMRGFDRLNDLKSFEFRVAERKRLTFASLLMGGPHAGTGFDADDKLHGTAEIEQAYVDFRISPSFNIRAPGIDLVPTDWLNLYHEPTNFYSVMRPELDNGLIPSTWKAPAASNWGQIVEALNYQFQISQALEDFGGDFDQRTDANTVPLFPVGYAPGIDGIDALGFSQAPLGDFRQLSNYLGYTFRLSYQPGFLPGFGRLFRLLRPKHDTTRRLWRYGHLARPLKSYDLRDGFPVSRP